jgi:acetyl-CoA carboxylase biotin carboxyl carrier protein
MTTKGSKNNLDLVKELVQLIKENDLAEIELEQSDKDSESIYVRVTGQKGTPSPMTSKPQSETPMVQTQRETNENVKELTAVPTLENNPGTLLSPMVGTVYLAPEPEADVFVQIGDKVVAGQTILIVEAMKTLNQIPAVKDGVIKRILVEDGTPVEYGSPLVVIE